MGELSDKVAVITGGGTGIGRATALLFAQEGAKVVVAGRREEPLRETTQTTGGLYFVGDVSVAADAERIVQRTIEKYGCIDILVNNAGCFSSGNVEQTDDATWQSLYDGNVKSVYVMSQTAIPKMRVRENGSIVNVASILGVVGAPATAAYSAAKAAIIALTRSMAIDYADSHIRVNCVSPSLIDTEMTQGMPKPLKDKIIDDHPLRRIGTPEDVANAVLYLASDRASWITGVNLPIDGGLSAK